jgi:hypothetical protein
MVNQKEQIFPTLTKGWNLNMMDTESVIKIFTELPRLL